MRLLLAVLFSLTSAVWADDRHEAPHFCGHSHDGETHSLSGRPGRILVLNFWATWCGPCRREIPILQRLHREYAGRGVDVVGVAMDERGWRTVGPFMAQHGVEYPVVLFRPQMARLYGRMDDLPRTVFVDRRGRIAATVNRVLDEEALRRVIELLLRESGDGKGEARGSACVTSRRTPHHDR